MPRGPDGPHFDYSPGPGISGRLRKPACQRALAGSQAQTPDRVNVPALRVRKRGNSFCTAIFFTAPDSGRAQSSAAPVALRQSDEFLDFLVICTSSCVLCPDVSHITLQYPSDRHLLRSTITGFQPTQTCLSQTTQRMAKHVQRKLENQKHSRIPSVSQVFLCVPSFSLCLGYHVT